VLISHSPIRAPHSRFGKNQVGYVLVVPRGGFKRNNLSKNVC
jgi:hypothetical protein